MAHKRVIFGSFSALLLLLLVLLGLRRANQHVNSDGYKELYREAMHNLTADMEAIQRKRRDVQTN